MFHFARCNIFFKLVMFGISYHGYTSPVGKEIRSTVYSYKSMFKECSHSVNSIQTQRR